MRFPDAGWLLTAVTTACTPAPSRPAQASPHEASVAQQPSDTAGDASSGDKDWMWELIGGARLVYVRSEDRCERWRLRPTGNALDFVGRVVLDDGGEMEMGFRYQGNPPRLDDPRAVEGGTVLGLPCEGEERVGWFLSETDCDDRSAAPPLAATGCIHALDASTRARIVDVMSGKPRDALLARLKDGARLWRGESCEPTWVREKGDRLYLYGEGDYPETVSSTAIGLLVGEVAEKNPHAKPRRESIAIGCCGKPRAWAVVEVGETAAVLRNDAGTETRWYFQKNACAQP
jgi:hypothetical protein